jgi:hypothetical protein
MAADDDFWSRVSKGPGCWEWAGTHRRDGYGVFWDGRRQTRAHRAAWELTNGPIPDGLSVLHSCDNPPCVRPDHLRLGSQRDNMADMDNRGRRFSPFVGQVQAGERNRNARLTADQVAHIRGMAAAGHYHDDIAARYGTTRANVSQIVRGFSWPDVEPVPYPPVTRDRPLGRSAPRRRAGG